jgi:dihydroorotase
MQEFERCPFGIIGLETAIGLALERLYHTGTISLMNLIGLFTTGPERVVSLGRGSLSPGAPADITVLGLDHEWTYDVNRSPSKSRNTPFHGRKFKGGPVATIVSGRIVWEVQT